MLWFLTIATNMAPKSLEHMKPKHITLPITFSFCLAATALLTDPAASRADTIYVANASTSTLERFTSGGVGSLFANTGLNGPIGLAFDSGGNLYAANSGDNTIQKFTPGGAGSLFAISGLSQPWGLAFDSAGYLFAANFANNTIEKFTPGGVGSLFANTGLTDPTFIAIQVPEPSTWALLGLGLPALLVVRRRRA
jgi:DNA-binding beta-propeller fold protein YncE